jgi:hypothetical protein
MTTRVPGRQRGRRRQAAGHMAGAEAMGRPKTIRAQIDANVMVPEAGLEPGCPCEGWILNLNQTKIKSQ